MAGRNRIGGSHGTASSPSYRTFSSEMGTAVGTAAVLQALTMLAMVLLADTPVAGALAGLWRVPILGVIVFGVALTAGRYVGMKGFTAGNLGLAFVGAALSVLTYGLFGGLVLTPYAPGTYVPAMAVATAITVVIAAIAGAYVLSTDRDLSHWSRYSTWLFLGGLGTIAVGSFVFQLLLLVGFVLFLLGFLADLVYEIYRTSNRDRTPLANGFGLYIAFAGVFVHVLQLVLRMLADRG